MLQSRMWKGESSEEVVVSFWKVMEYGERRWCGDVDCGAVVLQLCCNCAVACQLRVK